MKTIEDYNFSGKKALIRVDFNVPLDGDLNVTDETRIKGTSRVTIESVLVVVALLFVRLYTKGIQNSIPEIIRSSSYNDSGL